MKFEALRLLSVKTNRLILAALDEPKTSSEIFEEVKEEASVKTREAVYRALERMKESGLVEKKYDSQNNKMLYSKPFSKLAVDLRSMKIQGRS